MKELLQECVSAVKSKHSFDPSVPTNVKRLLGNEAAFQTYVKSLSEGLDKQDAKNFAVLAENTRISLMENSMFQINPYETLSLPILRVFYPKLVGREAVTLSPMDKPESVKIFLKADFTPSNSNTSYPAPVIGTDISQGPTVGIPTSAVVAVPSNKYDVLATISLDKTKCHLERDFLVAAVSADGTTYTSVNLTPAIEGHFSQVVTVGGQEDVISGFVDYLNGTLTISSATGKVKFARFSATCSLEENKVNPKITLKNEKIRLYAKDRQISASWTINMEQDLRALFDLSVQAEMVNLLSQQISLDIDREIILSLIAANSLNDAATHVGTFKRDPEAGYAWGPKYWHENIISTLNVLSNQIYTDTNINAGNVILCNPVDVAILEDLQTFTYTGMGASNGELGYRSATLAGGKWRVLTSSVVPQGTMPIVMKMPEENAAVYYYAPYVPAVLHPYPIGAIPTLTILSRYATSLVRSSGISLLNIA